MNISNSFNVVKAKMSRPRPRPRPGPSRPRPVLEDYITGDIIDHVGLN